MQDDLIGSVEILIHSQQEALEGASLSGDQVLNGLESLAFHSWNAERLPGRGLAAPDLRQALIDLCLELGILTRRADGDIAFTQPALRDAFVARELMQRLSSDYADRGAMLDGAVNGLRQIGAPAVPLLIDALGDADDIRRRAAAMVLQKIGAAALPGLKRALRQGNQKIRRAAAHALAAPELANAALPELLTAVKEDDRADVRWAAVHALGLTGNADAVPVLIAALDDPDPIVRQTAERAIAQFDSPLARRALDAARRRPVVTEPAIHSPTAQSGAVPSVVDLSRRPRVFLSYAREDAEPVGRVRRLLQLAGFEPWMDSQQLRAGEAWTTRLVEAIRASDFVIGFLSGRTRDGYQMQELRMAVEFAPPGRDAATPFVLPCIVDSDATNAADLIPDFLAGQHAVTLTRVDDQWKDLYLSLRQATVGAGLPVPTLLRSEPRPDLDHSAATRMIVEMNFFDNNRNRSGDAPASRLYEVDGHVIEDRATGRLWTRRAGGPLQFLSGSANVLSVVRQANEERFYGLDKWRVPTLEEAMSLMTKQARTGGLYLSPLLSDAEYVWTGDSYADEDPYHAGRRWHWVACYGVGTCQPVPPDAPAQVRLVRHAWD